MCSLSKQAELMAEAAITVQYLSSILYHFVDSKMLEGPRTKNLQPKIRPMGAWMVRIGGVPKFQCRAFYSLLL